ncbi:phosphotriesterase [Kribbella sp. NPDC049227]|uniref:phosphotriesterase family protein n=1 Tax=Kribbella sp. NPDC049227 TaxID=3364113 RepID=UPI00371486D7
MTTPTELYAQTVTGLVQAHALGRVLCHEHVVLRTPGFAESYPWTYPRREIIDRCVDVLAELRDSGISTIVDNTTIDLGRDAELLAEVSQRSGITIIAATGCHLVTPRFVFNRSPDEFAALLIRDLTEGIAATGVRAGVIKCATDEDGVTATNETVLRACARAHLATGAPISTHTHAAGRTGLAQLRIFADEGVDPSRVLIGHSGDTDDFDYLHALADAGAYLGADRFGGNVRCSEETRVKIVAELCRAGRADRVMLAHDTNVWSEKEPPGWRELHRPQWHYRHVLDDVVPELRSLGVEQVDVDRMLVANPAVFFPYLRPSQTHR